MTPFPLNAAIGDELRRLRAMSDAAVEGIAVVSDAGIVLEANVALAAMLGRDARSLTGTPLADLFLNGLAGADDAGEPIEVALAGSGGGGLPAEMHRREITLAGQPHRLFAFQDLRARRVAEERMARHARHDPLTGLRNRLGLEQAMMAELTRAERYGADFAVLCLDLDGFKAINDVHGHPAGDEVLRVVASRLNEVTRETDLCFRLGGDEFLILQSYTAEAHQSGRLAERLVTAIAKPFLIGDTPSVIGVSIGIAHFPSHGRTVDALLRNADAALYKAKHEGKNTHRFFDPSLNAALEHRRAIETELMHAIDRGELELTYEPQVEVASGAVAGFEARLRWNNARLGTVDPAVFVPIAEDAGLMNAIGEWAIDQACRQAAGWTRPLGVAVRLSLFQLRSGDAVATFAQALRASGLDPARLRVDVGETTVIQGGGRISDLLARLKALGIGLGIDEFGSGPASITVLHAGHFDRVKLDRTFAAGPLDRVRAVVAAARMLGLQVAGDGVATAEARDRLADAGCHLVQGEFLSPPRAIAAFAAFTGGAPQAVPRQGSPSSLTALREMLGPYDPGATRVLVVDDSEMVAETLSAMLSAFGFRTIDRAGDGSTALAKLHEAEYGLVISDWNMAPVTGIELLASIRAAPRLRDVRFLMLTANARAASRIAARDAGVDGFLVKPFRPDALAHKIRDLFAMADGVLDRAG